MQIFHVFEATRPGQQVFVMGPKPVYGEWVDGVQVTPTGPVGEELAPLLYDGVVLESPATDANFEVTSYRFSVGEHTIEWKPVEGLSSNILRIRAR